MSFGLKNKYAEAIAEELMAKLCMQLDPRMSDNSQREGLKIIHDLIDREQSKGELLQNLSAKVVETQVPGGAVYQTGPGAVGIFIPYGAKA